MKSRLKLCTFDVTNTLLKFRTSVGEQYAKVGRLYGIKREPDKITNAFMHYWKIMNSDHPNFGRNTGLTSHLWWKEMVRNSFSLGPDELKNGQLDAISDHLYDLYRSNICWKVTSGSEELLRRLKEKHIVLGVISNFDERLDSVLLANGLKSYFDFILASYIVKIAKPSREIFNLALSHTSGITSAEALHIGDNIKLDYLAAKEAGWNALLLCSEILNEENSKYVNPNEVVTDVQQIEQYILSS
ncbi:rhythmically expressed gene 2 protein-like [Stegodyphus dumicola]|uniref:rhythmically expressed gene 2 protein-like n=1 Tax=Stegodyphus dumicola TaxID=202533 RepID=UPI0015AF6F68|nr:rhythmically expressed gene 2 protein-like [Stegodyphus dumicola]